MCLLISGHEAELGCVVLPVPGPGAMRFVLLALAEASGVSAQANPPATGTPSLAPGAWTDVGWAKCDTVDDGGRWDVSTHDSGKWMKLIERESGRCLAISLRAW